MGIINLVMNSDELQKKFEHIYETRIVPKIAPLEQERLKIKFKCLPWFILAAMTVIPVALVTMESLKIPVWLLILLLIVTVIFVFIGAYPIVSLLSKIKSELLTEILKLFGNFNRYTKTSGLISLAEIKSAGLFPCATDKYTDDDIAGTYKGLDVVISEVRLAHTVKVDKQRHSVTDFKGLIIKTTLNKPYQGKTLLFQKNDINQDEDFGAKFVSTLSNLGNFRERRILPDMQKVLLEDPRFNEIYEVYSNDQIESRYIITPTFMERLTNVRKIIQASDVHCYFEDKYMTLYLSTNRNFFEIGSVFSTLYDKARFQEVFEQLVSIFELIHYFKLDKKLGL